MKLTTVVHCKKDKYDVYIGRPGKWCNPFKMGRDGNRKEVVEKHEKWIVNQLHLLADLHELKGKILGCWCKPQICHGDILAKLCNEGIPKEKNDSTATNQQSVKISPST